MNAWSRLRRTIRWPGTILPACMSNSTILKSPTTTRSMPAIQCYLRTLELDPKHLEGSFKLMELALNHKKSDLAIKVMEDAVEQNVDEPLAYYNLISVYDKCKMFEQAEQARQRLKERFAKRSKTSSTS